MEKYAGYSTKSESSKPTEEDENEVRNLKLIYRNTEKQERDKSSGVSSDDETTSSSLLPIPDTLRQMRTELKRTITDIGEPSEVESSLTAYEVVEESSEKVRNSLDELRRKYTLKTETSVAIKMDSAKLMLDDILSRNNINANYCESPSFYREKEFKPKAVLETETSTTDSIVEYPKHRVPTVNVPQVVPHSLSPIAFGYPPHICPTHGNGFKHVCGAHSPQEKVSKPSEENAEEPQRRTSLVEKLQNLHIKCKIQSVYRMMQKKTNPFGRSRREPEEPEVEQGIPGSSTKGPGVSNEPTGCKCEANKFSKTQYQYPRKMIFDLVETSESSRSESKSTERIERPGFCTCYKPKECSCPEVLPRCICGAVCNCEGYNSENAENPSKERTPRTSAPEKVSEYIQTDAEVVSRYQSENQSSDVEKKEEDSQIEKQSDPKSQNEKSVAPEREKKGFRRYYRKQKTLERTDIYYFDHGNSAYYQTTDHHPVRYTECLVDRTDEYATKFWAEIFGAFEVGIAFIISFIIQFYRFIFTSIIRSLTIGLLQIFSDYFFKPILTIIFNGIIQPCLILAYNIATSFRDLCLPISQTFGFFAKEVANIFRSCRLVEVNQCNCKQSSCYCGNKV